MKTIHNRHPGGFSAAPEKRNGSMSGVFFDRSASFLPAGFRNLKKKKLDKYLSACSFLPYLPHTHTILTHNCAVDKV